MVYTKIGFVAYCNQYKTERIDQESIKMTTILLVCKAIKAIGQFKGGASRQAICAYLVANNGKKAGGAFNATLRRALSKGVESGVLKQGATAQRFKFGDGAKALLAPPKKKKVVKKKKKTVKKKKKVTKKKKKTTKKKKKKVTKKKKKTATKKRKVTKKKAAKKSKKKVTKKKKKVPRKRKN